jgi:hypothetical protein
MSYACCLIVGIQEETDNDSDIRSVRGGVEAVDDSDEEEFDPPAAEEVARVRVGGKSPRIKFYSNTDGSSYATHDGEIMESSAAYLESKN